MNMLLCKQCIGIYACNYTHLNVNMYKHINIDLLLITCICIDMCIWIFIYITKRMNLYMSEHTNHIYPYKQTNIYTHIYIQTYIHNYICPLIYLPLSRVLSTDVSSVTEQEANIWFVLLSRSVITAKRPMYIEKYISI